MDRKAWSRQMKMRSFGLAVLALCATALLLPGGRVMAQTVSPAPAPSAPVPSAPNASAPAAPVTPAPAAPPATTPKEASPPAGLVEEPGASQAPGISGDATVQTLDVPARPVVMVSGSATWDDGFKTIKAAIETINGELTKAGIAPAGHPIANFVQVNDSNFKFEAMVPIAARPDGKTDLGNGAKFAMSPAGKALKFQHRGAYDDIESTYDLITAFLDEKGLKAQDFFIEEYLTALKDTEDQNLEVDIYIFLQ